jgi:hypothetical protein
MKTLEIKNGSRVSFVDETGTHNGTILSIQSDGSVVLGDLDPPTATVIKPVGDLSAIAGPVAGSPHYVMISTKELAAGKVGVAYSTPLMTDQPSGPCKFSITSGVLPVGLALNAVTGVISGTPSVAGTSTFYVKAINAANVSSVPQSLSITVV